MINEVEMMEVIHALLQERNATETEPFSAVIESNTALNASVCDFQHRYSLLQIENARHKEDLDRVRSQSSYAVCLIM